MIQPPMPQGSLGQPEPPERVTRPEDVDTAFWLWVVALPLMIASYVCDAVSAPGSKPFVVAVTAGLSVVLVTVVLTFLMLMRGGYRWARTVLVAGALTSILFTASSLFSVQRPAVAAVIYAGTGIIGAVLLAGGIVLLHRKDANAYFTR